MKSSIFRRGRSDSVEREPLIPAIPGPSVQYEVKHPQFKVKFVMYSHNALLFQCYDLMRVIKSFTI